MNSTLISSLPAPPEYFPLEDGVYHVRAGLRALRKEASAADPDSLVFQFDSEFQRYRDNKEACRAENLGKYYVTKEDSTEVERHTALWMIERLLKEHPEYFSLQTHPQGSLLQCGLSEEQLIFDGKGDLFAPKRYSSLFDAVCSQVQEDAAIVRVEKGGDWVAALHLCAPNHWAAADKIGRTFREVHRPVAEIDPLLATTSQLLQAMVHKGPYERFAWGIASDTMLNHHPQLPPQRKAGRAFSAEGPELFLRIERQTMHGFPDKQAFVFTIRTYFRDCAELSEAELNALISAIDSMTAESRCYKGLLTEFDAVRERLTDLRRQSAVRSS